MKTIKTKKIVKKKQQIPWNAYIIFAVTGIFIVLSLILLSRSGKKIEGDKLIEKPLSPFEVEKRDITGKLPGQKSRDDIERPIIKSIKFIPEQPTIFDDIKAEVTSSYKEDGRITCMYQWKINGKTVDGVKGDTLSAGLFKKKDQISVIATPYADDIEGYPYEGMFIVVHSAPPSLELRETKQKLNNTIELQLVSKDPDNDKVTFSLEEPYPEGITINKETGKITWKPKEKEKRIYKFRASATDIDGVKTTKTFEVIVE
ncbi:MAG: Ig domain-containing protein [Nitrospirota bacterium]